MAKLYVTAVTLGFTTGIVRPFQYTYDQAAWDKDKQGKPCQTILHHIKIIPETRITSAPSWNLPAAQ
jgi:hypothetical protein